MRPPLIENVTKDNLHVQQLHAITESQQMSYLQVCKVGSIKLLVLVDLKKKTFYIKAKGSRTSVVWFLHSSTNTITTLISSKLHAMSVTSFFNLNIFHIILANALVPTSSQRTIPLGHKTIYIFDSWEEIFQHLRSHNLIVTWYVVEMVDVPKHCVDPTTSNLSQLPMLLANNENTHCCYNKRLTT